MRAAVTQVNPDWRPPPSPGGIGAKKRQSPKRANSKQWEQIRGAKLGPCRVCKPDGPYRSELHHLVPRSQGGVDTKSNLVPLCRSCHDLVTRRDRQACAELRSSLSDAEYAYAVECLGEDVFESYYPVEWKHA